MNSKGALELRYQSTIATDTGHLQVEWTVAKLATLTLEESIVALEKSSYFDTDWYIANNPDVAKEGMRASEHFLLFGADEGRLPSAHFSATWYSLAYSDVPDAKTLNPLLHFIFIGEARGRIPLGPGTLAHATPNDIIAFVLASGLFDEEWYVRMSPDLAGSDISPVMHYLRWGANEGRNPSRAFHTKTYMSYEEVAATGLNPLLHYMLFGRDAGLSPERAIEIDKDIYDVVFNSEYFDEKFYLENNPDIDRSGLDACEHFCTFGYRDLRNPSAAFDLPWYLQTYLPDDDETNPLIHFELEGRKIGYLPRSPIADFNLAETGVRYEGTTPLRRACLFAAFDPHGIVDDYVVAYVKELSRFADVYFLADCEMQSGELAKLAPFVRGAWAIRHGCYDFGSYRKLATELVGWPILESYDEVMFVNDSCYCIRPLDHVFEKMDAAICDWWGLQATKGIWPTRNVPGNAFAEAIPLATVRSELISKFERDYTYDFLIGSYFLVFRRSVLADPAFQQMIGRVRKQPTKKLVVQKYEIGLTRFLIHAGFSFDTFADYLYPLHPVYSLNHFELIRNGFPLLKRFLLTENHYMAPGLDRWKELLHEAEPSADLVLVQNNLDRVADQEKLYRSFNIRLDEHGKPVAPPLLSNEAFTALDVRMEKHDDWWVFPVCAFNHTLAGNERAVFERVKNDPAIKKIILYRSKRIKLDGVNVEQALLKSQRGQELLIGSRVVFIKHTPTSNLVYPLAEGRHYLINLWHGIPLKRIGFASRDQQNNLKRLALEHQRCKAVIASSKVDRMAMASAFYPLQYNDVWVTGLPRNDFILRSFDALPVDLQSEACKLEETLAGRKLILYAPTFRNTQEDGYYHFSQEELGLLSQLLAKHNAVLGIREHLADTARSYSEQLAPLGAIALGDHLYPNIEILYRAATLLLTDYSSCFFDFALTGKPMVSFAYDREQYERRERGFFYDMDDVFPGPICGAFGEVITALDSALASTAARHINYDTVMRLFFDYVDDSNGARVVQRVQHLLVNDEVSN